jgi:predicted dehydrogenase
MVTRGQRPAGGPGATGAQPLRVGFVGCGFVTRERHLPTLRRVPDVEVVAFCDPDPDALAAVAAGGQSARRYTTPQELMHDPEVEAVAVCSPPATHSELGQMAIEAGRHLLLEKPLAVTRAEADRLTEVAEASPVTAMMGHNLRWHRHLRAARELLASGKLGRLAALRSVFSDPLLSQLGPDSWRRRRESGGGIVVDRLIHHLDLWRFLTGEEVDEVFAVAGSGQVEHDRAAVTARTRGGAVISTMGLDDTATTHEVTLYGDRGAVHVDCYRFDGLATLSLADLPGAPGTRLRRLAESMRDLSLNV